MIAIASARMSSCEWVMRCAGLDRRNDRDSSIDPPTPGAKLLTAANPTFPFAEARHH
jgi:hypothetical protein